MKNKIKELLKEIGGLSLHGHRNEGKWYGQEAELKDYEEFEELESLIEKQEKLLELYIDLANTIEVLDNAYGYGIFEFGEIKYICNKIKKEEENE